MNRTHPPWETQTMPWDWSPVSTSVLGDSGPWVWSVPYLWQALADPDGPWTAPEPHVEDRHGTDGLDVGIAYWLPLLALTMGALGWVRPDLGARRWLDAGMPTEDASALQVLRRWWGTSAGALEEWTATGGALPSYSRQVNENVGGAPTMDWSPGRPSTTAWPAVSAGGSDSLHLGHVVGHLCDEQGDNGDLIHKRADDAGRSAALTLESYSGWYAALARHGRTLPTRPDDRSWQVDVVVKPIGWLGTYRLSRVTGRWFTGRHRWHELGWNGAA